MKKTPAADPLDTTALEAAIKRARELQTAAEDIESERAACLTTASTIEEDLNPHDETGLLEAAKLDVRIRLFKKAADAKRRQVAEFTRETLAGEVERAAGKLREILDAEEKEAFAVLEEFAAATFHSSRRDEHSRRFLEFGKGAIRADFEDIGTLFFRLSEPPVDPDRDRTDHYVDNGRSVLNHIARYRKLGTLTFRRPDGWTTPKPTAEEIAA